MCHEDFELRGDLMLQRLRVPLILTALLAAALAHAAPGPQPAADQARKLIETYNDRSFGNPGWRRVRLDLKNGEEVTRTFIVTNVWQEEGNLVRTLFVLERPEGLRRTNYLLVEAPQEPAGMKVFLHLPAGNRGVLSIQPSRFDEGLLGSDFGYRDLRMKIPTAGFQLRVLGMQRMLDRNAWAVEAVPAGAETQAVASWKRSVYYLAETDPVLLGADHYQAATDRKPGKQLRVQGIRKIDGAWTETQMTMSSADGRSSVLSLLDFRATVPDLDNAFFDAETLPTVADRLFRLRIGPKVPESQPGRSRR
jgi:hypothetical protein